MDTLTQGIELQQQGKYAEALPLFQQTVEEHPESYIGWTNLSETLLETGQYQGALKAAEKALKIHSQYAPAWVMKARALNGLNPPRPEEGIAACNRAISFDPNLAIAYLQKGLILYDQERGQESLIEFDRALMIDSNSYEALFYKARSLSVLERYSEALVLAERMIQLDPNNPAGWRAKAFDLFMIREHVAAVQAVDRALAMDSNDSSALTLKASILEEMGRKSEARRLLRRAAEINPQDEVIEEFKAEMDRQRNEKVVNTTVDVVGTVGKGLFAGLVEFIKAIFTGW